MRLSVAWAAVAAQNVTLKVGVVSLAIVSISLAIVTAQLSLRKPLLIERGCLTRAVDLKPTSHDVGEIETFIREAIRQRFNSDAVPIPDYLTSEEEVARAKEQKEFVGRDMTQTVIIRGLKVDGSKISVDADRLIAVAHIRSAFLFPLMATIATTSRTESNPYGLQLVKIEQAKQEASK